MKPSILIPYAPTTQPGLHHRPPRERGALRRRRDGGTAGPSYSSALRALPEAPGGRGGGNGENGRIDRDMTPLGSNQKVNYPAFGVLCGSCASIGPVVDGRVFSTKEPQTKEKARTAPNSGRPGLFPRPPPPAIVQNVRSTRPRPPPPLFDEMAAERERLLLLQVQGLQKQLFERRRSKMLVVSDPAAQQPAVQSAALPADGGTASPRSPYPAPSVLILMGTIRTPSAWATWGRS